VEVSSKFRWLDLHLAKACFAGLMLSRNYQTWMAHNRVMKCSARFLDAFPSPIETAAQLSRTQQLRETTAWCFVADKTNIASLNVRNGNFRRGRLLC